MDIDVIVAGGGPVGFMAATELQLAGAATMVLEQNAVPSGQSRALGLHARTVEVLDMRGLLDRIGETAPVWPRGHFAGLRKVDLTQLDGEHTYALMVPQSQTEALLARRAGELGADIRRGHRVAGLVQEPDGVRVTVEGPAGEYEVRGRYLVGCDGGGSMVRKLAGIGFPGTAATVNAVLGDVRISGDQPSSRELRRVPGGLFAMIPLGDDLYRVVAVEFDTPPVPREIPLTTQELRDTARRVSGEDLPIVESLWLSRFGDATRHADTYRRGRVFVAGDAAHVHFPAGGQGLNTGMQDAVNLGWKLGAAVRGDAPEKLLDTYHDERFPVAERVCMNTRAQLAMMHPGDHITPLRELFSELMDLPQVNRYLAEMITGIDIRYPMDAPDHPLLGRRVPPLRLTLGSGAVVTPSALLHKARGVLIDATPGGSLAAAVAGWRDRVDHVTCRTDSAQALLIRPDGYVAWASTGDPTGLAHALHTWFGAANRQQEESMTASPALYQDIQRFYARHMHLIDEGDLDTWVTTFAPDAVISNNIKPMPAKGRAAIKAVTSRAHAQMSSAGVQQRHWTGMLVVEPISDDRVRARSYAMIVETSREGRPIIERSTVCRDELVRVGDGWQIQERRVHHDGAS